MSFLVPTVVRPAIGFCGTYVAVGSSNGDKALSAVTQVISSDELMSLRLEKHMHRALFDICLSSTTGADECTVFA